MILTPAERAEIAAGRQNIAIFFRLETDPVVRLWLGFGDIKPGINTLDPVTGETYHGFGELTSIPEWQQAINGSANRVEFTLSGVSGDLLRIASGGDAEQVKGKRVAVGFAFMGPDWKTLGPVRWPAQYVADFLTVNQAVTDDPEQPIVRTISLSCGSMFTGRWRPGLGYFTDADEQIRHPGNRFCERVSSYANGFNKAWPVFS